MCSVFSLAKFTFQVLKYMIKLDWIANTNKKMMYTIKYKVLVMSTLVRQSKSSGLTTGFGHEKITIY